VKKRRKGGKKSFCLLTFPFRALLKDLVNLILAREEAVGSKESRWMMLLTVVCAGVYAALPQIMRLASPTLFATISQPVSFWIICERCKVLFLMRFLKKRNQLSPQCSQTLSFAPWPWMHCRKVWRSFGFGKGSRGVSLS
jgi:hypothetical protein